MSLSKYIEDCKLLCENIEKIQVQTAVESIDLGEIKSDLQDVIEKLLAVQEYQQNPDTNYDELLEERKKEIKELRAAQTSWIQTEIFKMLLKE